MKYYEVIRIHGYLNEVLGLNVTAENEEVARDIMKSFDYEVDHIDDDFDRIYVK